MNDETVVIIVFLNFLIEIVWHMFVPSIHYILWESFIRYDLYVFQYLIKRWNDENPPGITSTAYNEFYDLSLKLNSRDVGMVGLLSYKIFKNNRNLHASIFKTIEKYLSSNKDPLLIAKAYELRSLLIKVTLINSIGWAWCWLTLPVCILAVFHLFIF